MEQLSVTTSILWVLSSLLLLPDTASANSNSSGRPIQVVSDSYGIGSPTHYTIIKGTTKVTFSHPLLGQFRRAEVSVRENSGTKLTRFVLSKDGKTYWPSMQLETPFRKHGFSERNAVCIDPNAERPLNLVQALNGKVSDSEIIAKKREELIKAKFFDSSCFGPEFNEAHRNAIFNATADVLSTDTQNTSPEPKYLRCMEKYGFTEEAGIIQALVKQSTTDVKVNPKIRIACTADKKAKPGEFDEQTRTIWIKKTLKPVREDYATKILHELLHPVPVPDGFPLTAMGECCTRGEQCNVLKAYGNQKRQGSIKTTIAEFISNKSTVATGEITTLVGPANEASALGGTNISIGNFELDPTVKNTQTPQCQSLPQPVCDQRVDEALKNCSESNFEGLNEILDQCLPRSGARIFKFDWTQYLIPTCQASEALKDCPDHLTDIALAAKTEWKRTEISDTVPEGVPLDSPISWEAPKEVPLQLAHSTDPTDATATIEKPAPPARTIASISPLPDVAPQRQLGSANNRADVASTSRASAIVDTMERAAVTVTRTMTPEKFDQLKVDKTEIFTSNYKPKTKSPRYLVASTATGPMKVADIGDLQGLGFANPFANVKQKVDRSTGIFTTIDESTSGKSKKPVARNINGAITTVTNTGDIESNKTAPVGTALTNPLIAFSNGRTASPATQQVNRSPSSNKKYDFKKMDRAALIKFVTSDYRNIATELENPELKDALNLQRIQIFDSENRPIVLNLPNPTSTFVYRKDLGRLVPRRASR